MAERRAWTVVLIPDGINDKKNKAGLIVQLTNGEMNVEVCRVMFVRRNSKNKNVSFEEQLRVECEKAQLAADAVNDANDNFERAYAEQALSTRDRIRELLGPAPRAGV